MRKKNNLNIIRSKNVAIKKGKWKTKLKIICDRKTPTDSLMVGIAILEKGVETEKHYHDIEELQYIIEGEALVHDYSGNEFFVTKDDFVYCPSGVRGTHAFKNIGRKPLKILFIYPSNKGKRPKVMVHNRNKLQSQNLLRRIKECNYPLPFTSISQNKQKSKRKNHQTLQRALLPRKRKNRRKN